VKRLLVAVSILLCLTGSAGSAYAHSVPRKWWVDETTALKRLEAVERSQKRVSSFSGRCRGLAPWGMRAGRAVYKHFSCSARIRSNGVTFTFLYRVHVRGPRGQIALGG
jgi:hypothetical protein